MGPHLDRDISKNCVSIFAMSSSRWVKVGIPSSKLSWLPPLIKLEDFRRTSTLCLCHSFLWQEGHLGGSSIAYARWKSPSVNSSVFHKPGKQQLQRTVPAFVVHQPRQRLPYLPQSFPCVEVVGIYVGKVIGVLCFGRYGWAILDT